MKKRYNVIIAVLTILAVGIAASCAKDYAANTDSGGSGNGNGQGGSMARFTIVGDHLYVVDNSTLKTIRIADPANPERLPSRDQYMNFDIETIFSYNDMLFIGSRSAMYIYDITRPELPKLLSQTSHFTSCDPVVAAGNYAYVTLSSANDICFRGSDELIVFDITDPRMPLRVWEDTSIRHPGGLGVDEHYKRLFVCDYYGLRFYDLTDPSSPEWIGDLADVPGATDIRTYDVIPRNGLLIVIGEDGLYQFDYTQQDVRLVSKIVIPRNS